MQHAIIPLQVRRLSLAALFLASAGCSNLTGTQNDTLGGAGVGAAGGAVIGALAGGPALGALIGAGVGAGGGYLYGRSKHDQRVAYSRGYRQGRETE